MTGEFPPRRPRVCAVSYLNTVPLVWGFLHGSQRDDVELSFCLPSECADRLEDGTVDVGLVPAVELPRLGLEVIRGTGIASCGPVLSILLVTKCPLSYIRTMAADAGSRTSVALAQILLAEIAAVRPAIVSMRPVLDQMLEVADAALIIGDPALHLDTSRVPYQVLDLGAEWTRITGTPMVFAVWAGRRGGEWGRLAALFKDSYKYGMERIEEIVATESGRRGLAPELVREYLTRHIRLELGDNEYKGLELFHRYAARIERHLPARVEQA